VPFAFVKNVVQIAFLTHGCCKATSVSLCGNLSVGSLTMRNDQPALRALFACDSGLSEPEIGLEHDKWQHLHGAHLQKQLQIAFCHFHLISSVSRPQRPLIYD
jgi:hypothetical protein